MPPMVALISCLGLIALLFRIERKHNPAATAALWIPTISLLIQGSRPIGRWLAPGSSSIEEGSSADRFVLITLISLALFVVSTRSIPWSKILRANVPLLVLCLYASLSILWSDFPFLSMKRWLRLAGIIPIAAVVLTERSPLQAMESVLRRCSYVLIPLSFILITYFPQVGRTYGRYSGHEMWTGVTLTKNALGHLCMVSALFLVWMLFRRWRVRDTS